MAPLTYRPATMADAKDLWRWKNQPETRQYSIVTQDIIPWPNHLKWLETTLHAHLITKLYIIECDGFPCGDIRLDRLPAPDHGHEVSVRLERHYWNRGIATQAIREALPFGRRYIAKFVNGNIASMRAFVNCGFKPFLYKEKPVGHYIFEYVNESFSSGL